MTPETFIQEFARLIAAHIPPPAPPPDKVEFWTVQETAAAMKLKADTVREMIQRGDIKAFTVSSPTAKRGCWRVPVGQFK